MEKRTGLYRVLIIVVEIAFNHVILHRNALSAECRTDKSKAESKRFSLTRLSQILI